MKKLNAEFFLQLILGIASIALMIGGTIMFVTSLFTPLSTFNAIMLMAAGAILYTGVRIYFMFLETTSSIKDYVKGISSQIGTNNLTPELLKSEVININEDTTPEQLDEIKKKFPMIADQLNTIINSFGDNAKNVQNMSVQQLQKELQEAVDNNEFEKAAEIRDILKKKTL